MKSKDISIWEQYIEYMVLVVAVAILGWFAWGAFGTKIEYRQGRITVQTDSVDDELLKAANALESSLRDGSASPITINAPEALLDKFTKQMTMSISPRDRVIFPTIDMTSELDANQDVQSELREYVSPVVPEPRNVRTRQWFGTIAETVMSETSGLSDIVVDGPPHDTMWVQIAGTVDVDEIVQSYAEAGELSAIPSQWYDGAIDIFDVEIQRQVMTINGWSEPEVISILPGHMSFRKKLNEKKIDAIERNDIIRDLRSGKQGEIITPDFFPLKGFTPKELKDPSVWTGEVEFEESPMQLLQSDLMEAQDDIKKQQDEIAKIKEDIVDAGNSGEGGSSGGRGGGSGSSGNDRKMERLKKKLERAEQKLAEFVEAKATIQKAIDELNASDSMQDGEETVLKGEMWVWGHDMNVEPGSTYRYRLQLQLANPFFGHKPSLYPQQHAMADHVVMPSAQSEWTAPIDIEKSEQWFVKKAKSITGFDADDLQNHGYVSVDVFKFSDGQWTKKSRDIRVGQPIAVGDNPEGLGWFVLDVIEDVQGEVALLQHIQTGELLAKRPQEELASIQLLQLLRTMREQSAGISDDAQDGDSGGATEPPSDGGIGGGGRGGGGGGRG